MRVKLIADIGEESVQTYGNAIAHKVMDESQNVAIRMNGAAAVDLLNTVVQSIFLNMIKHLKESGTELETLEWLIDDVLKELRQKTNMIIYDEDKKSDDTARDRAISS